VRAFSEITASYGCYADVALAAFKRVPRIQADFSWLALSAAAAISAASDCCIRQATKHPLNLLLGNFFLPRVSFLGIASKLISCLTQKAIDSKGVSN
jgi:hypothetical protein